MAEQTKKEEMKANLAKQNIKTPMEEVTNETKKTNVSKPVSFISDITKTLKGLSNLKNINTINGVDNIYSMLVGELYIETGEEAIKLICTGLNSQAFNKLNVIKHTNGIRLQLGKERGDLIHSFLNLIIGLNTTGKELRDFRANQLIDLLKKTNLNQFRTQF